MKQLEIETSIIVVVKKLYDARNKKLATNLVGRRRDD